MFIRTCKLFFYLNLHHAGKMLRNHISFSIKHALKYLYIMYNTPKTEKDAHLLMTMMLTTTSTAMTMTRAVITLATTTTGIPAVK